MKEGEERKGRENVRELGKGVFFFSLLFNLFYAVHSFILGLVTMFF